MNSRLFQKLWHRGGTNEQAIQKAEAFNATLRKVSEEMKILVSEIEDLLRIAEDLSPRTIPAICLTRVQARHLLTLCQHCNRSVFGLEYTTSDPVPATCLRKDVARHLPECDRCKKLMLAFKVKAKVEEQMKSP